MSAASETEVSVNVVTIQNEFGRIRELVWVTIGSGVRDSQRLKWHNILKFVLKTIVNIVSHY
jgi:hypothetical protein